MLGRWSHGITVLIFVYSLTDVIYGVRFTVEPSDKVAALDKSLFWNCQAEDDANSVTYGWTFNTVTLPLRENQVIYSNGSLLIQKVTYDDVGTYTCSATAGETTVYSRTAKLDIAYINPTFTTQPVSQTAILGDNVVLSCHIDSLPPADVRWTLNGETVTSGDINQDSNGTSTLTLYPVMYYHVGTYKCVGSNPLTPVYRYSNDAALVVRGQPVFLSSLKSVSVPLGFQATFVCYFHGNPEPQITWFVHQTSNGDVISNEIQSSEKYTVYDNGTFIINDVTEQDEAFYTCTVGNSFGEMSESAMLTVTGPATPPEFTFKPSNNTVKEGDSVMFLCTCSGNPEPTSTWKKGSVEVSENSSLSINQVQSEDTGWFTCFCENDVGSVSQSVYLDVYTSPVITSAPEDVVVKKEDPIFLHCSAIGNPAPSISWLTPQFGSVIQSATGVVLYLNGSLAISSATLDDSGDYTCLARNIVGMVEASSSVTVEVAPVLTLLPLSQGVKVGSRVFLHCQASGVPDPIYSWSKDGEGMIYSTSQRQIYLNNTLVIHSVTKQDEGVYRCLAGNNLGVTRAVATITVTVPPSFRTVPNNNTVQLGSSVQLQCVADGDPVPTQRWTKDDRQLILDDNIVVTLDQSTLTITQIKATQFGKYTCSATNIAGTELVSAWLKVYDIPVFSVIPSDTVVKQSATLTLQCQGQAIEAPSVNWYKGREGEMTLLMNGVRVTVTDGGLLQIKSVEQNDEGWYTCVVQNTAGAISREAFVDVQAPPRILSTNSPQSAAIQSQVTLTCQSSGDPAPTLLWINPSGNVISSSSAYQIMDNVLRISSISKDDVGNWTCKYCNPLGCDSTSVKLNLEGMPVIKSFAGTQDGSLVTIECTVEGNPKPTVTFTSQGQAIALGHTIKENRVLIEVEFLNTEYRCVAGNIHGTTFRTISVPSKMEAPTVSKIKSGIVTLSWKVPDSLGNLPLIGYAVQKKSDPGVTWQPVNVQGHDLLNQRSLDVPGLEASREYVFRVASRNILGLGEYSDQSSRVVAQSSGKSPSPPQNVLALETEPGIILIVWKKSQHLNAPIADVVYEYKIVRPTTNKDGGSEVIHSQGMVRYNETFQIRVDDLTEPGAYSFSIWARNIILNLSSNPVKIVLDSTGAEYLEPEPHAGINSFGRDKLIAIIAGSLGGIIVVIILVCVVSRIRTQRKSKSLSLLDHTLSLDQFYMENPKTLYNDDKYGSKRKSGHSFYSFDESFHSTMGSKGKQDGSVEYLGSNLSSDVLLVAKNPLYKETEIQRPISQASSRDKLYNENIQETACVQSEIELPDCDITIVKGLAQFDEGQGHIEFKADQGGETGNVDNNSDNFQEVLTMANNDEISDIYSGMNSNTSTAENPDQSSEHIYTSIHSGDLQSSSKHSVQTTKQSSKGGNKFGSQKLPLRVFSPEYVGNSSSTIAKAKQCDKSENTHKGRSTRSASPGVPLKGNDSNKPKPPIRVLSLDLLKPSVKVDVENDKNLKLLSESMLKEKETPDKRLKARNGDLNDNKNNRKDSATESSRPNGFHNDDKKSNILVNGEMCNGNDNGDTKDHKTNVSSKSPTATVHDELLHDSETRLQNGIKGDNSVPDRNEEYNPYNNFKLKQKPKNVIDDNFLTDAEIKQEVVSAELY